jgi:hypothetical protein
MTPKAQTDLTKVGDWVGVLPPDRDPATRRHRKHQGEWRSEHAGWPAGPPQRDRRVRQRYTTLPNWLAETHEGRDVRDAGPNLMSAEAITYTHERLTALSPIDGKAEPDRLWRNLLSSQPMAFSIAGHLSRHRNEAAALFSAALKTSVTSLAVLNPGDAVPRGHRLDGVEAEWFPPRKSHTGDMSGCDIAACLELGDGTRTLVTIELKYTDTFSAEPVSWTRYQRHLEELKLDEQSTAALVGAGCSQVLRQVMLTNSVRLRGVAPDAGPEGQVDRAIAVVLGRHDDTHAQHVAETLNAAVGSIVPVRFWSHRDLLQRSSEIAGLEQWARRMHERYVI